jgi:hypothetical protein
MFFIGAKVGIIWIRKAGFECGDFKEPGFEDGRVRIVFDTYYLDKKESPYLILFFQMAGFLLKLKTAKTLIKLPWII